MSRNEQKIIDFLKNSNSSFSRQELKKGSAISQDATFASCLKSLCFYEYIYKDDNEKYSLTKKKYTEETRKIERRNE